MKREDRQTSDPLLAQKLKLDEVSHDRLDYFLANGYRVLGQALYNSAFLRADDGDFYTVLSARLPLSGYSFTKSQRKLLRKNRSLFRFEIGPARKTDAKTWVNDLYGRKFPRKYCDNLDYFLLNERGIKAVDTWEIEIYKDDELIGFSFFDLGHESIYSKVGIYDPDFSEYSLGYYTMLEELAFAQDRNMKYYYPGYVVPGCRDFDYKHRLGDVEVKDWHTAEWQPYSRIKHAPLLLEQMVMALTGIKAELHARGIATIMVWNPNFNYPLWWYNSEDYLYLPVVLGFLDHEGGIKTNNYLVADPLKKTYQLLSCYPLDTSKQLAFFPKGSDSMMLFLPQVFRRLQHWPWKDAADLAAKFRK